MTTWLITGATGYLGSALARRLAEGSDEVHALVRRTDATDQRVVEHAYDGSLGSVADAVRGSSASVVVHAATHYVRDDGDADPAPMVQANLGLGTQVLQAMRGGDAVLVNLSTHFQHFGGEGGRPLNLYAATKQAFEFVIEYFCDVASLKAISLVLGDVYGPADPRPRLIPAIARALAEDAPLQVPASDPVVDPVYLDDAVDAIVLAASHARVATGHERFSVSSGSDLRLSELVSRSEEIAGRRMSVETSYPSSTRAVERIWRTDPLPGWSPRIDIDEGLRRVFREAGIGFGDAG